MTYVANSTGSQYEATCLDGSVVKNGSEPGIKPAAHNLMIPAKSPYGPGQVDYTGAWPRHIECVCSLTGIRCRCKLQLVIRFDGMNVTSWGEVTPQKPQYRIANSGGHLLPVTASQRAE